MSELGVTIVLIKPSWLSFSYLHKLVSRAVYNPASCLPPTISPSSASTEVCQAGLTLFPMCTANPEPLLLSFCFLYPQSSLLLNSNHTSDMS